MSSVPDAIQDFLDQERLAVVGVSRDPRQPANHIFRRLKETGHRVWAVNGSAEEVEGEPCYPDLKSLPEAVEGVVLAVPPSAASDLVRDCAELGISRVWMHRSFGEGSVSDQAARLGEEAGLHVIVGGCPMMYCGSVDLAHRCMRWFLERRGRIQA